MLDPDLLLRYARPGPRYTSYPTAPTWRTDLTRAHLDAGLQGVDSPASVYVHVPFCKQQCTYCGCNMVVAGRREPGRRYLDALERQVARLALPCDTLDVARIHLGGGTPTWFETAELERLYAILFSRFRPIEGAELSVEVDPEVTTDAHVDALAAQGVNRLSIGVQSLDPVVLQAVDRPQTPGQVAAVLDRARRHGMKGLNIDLMYGLPHQTPERFAGTLERIIEMRPERLAVFGYAHVPWLKPHQKRIDSSALPGPVERVALYLLAHRMLTEAGYEAIGLDHFALPDDELAVARRNRRLHRNFMGYTTRRGLDLVGLGPSAISEFRDRYVQQTVRLGRWWKAVEGDGELVEKGLLLSEDDRLRRAVIEGLMCNLEVRYPSIEADFGVDFHERFAAELANLAPLEQDGLVERHPDRLEVTERGRLLVRNVAMVFDAYLSRPAEGPRFSQTV